MSLYSIICEINNCRANLAQLYLEIKYAKEDIDNINREKYKYKKVFEAIDESIFHYKGKLNNLMRFNSNLKFVRKCVDKNTYILDNEVENNINNQSNEIFQNFYKAEKKLNDKIDELNIKINYYESKLRSYQVEYERTKEEEIH